MWADGLIAIDKFQYWIYQTKKRTVMEEALGRLVVSHQAVRLLLHGHLLKGRLLGPNSRANIPVSQGSCSPLSGPRAPW